MLNQNYGTDANIRAYDEILAANNFTVFVPNLFWRDLPGCELNSNNDADIDKSLNLIRVYDLDKGFEDITICLKWLRETPQCNGLVTVIGFGIGANLTYLAGLLLDFESTVCYDFEGINFFQENDIDMRRPMLIHLNKSTNDFLKNEKKEEFIKNIKNIDVNVYENCSNNFYRISDKNYDAEVSSISFNKTLQHIKKAFAKPHST